MKVSVGRKALFFRVIQKPDFLTMADNFCNSGLESNLFNSILQVNVGESAVARVDDKINYLDDQIALAMAQKGLTELNFLKLFRKRRIKMQP
jgi:hypothetical protein